MKTPFTFMVIVAGMISVCSISCKKTADDTSSDEAGEAGTTELTQPVPEGDHASWTFLTDGLLVNKTTVRVGEKTTDNPNAGHWIDLKPDGTYEYGVYGNTSYTGVWSYDNGNKVLELLPNDTSVKKSQWTLMWNEANFIMVGTAKYGDNNTQIRFVRQQERPKAGEG